MWWKESKICHWFDLPSPLLSRKPLSKSEINKSNYRFSRTILVRKWSISALYYPKQALWHMTLASCAPPVACPTFATSTETKDNSSIEDTRSNNSQNILHICKPAIFCYTEHYPPRLNLENSNKLWLERWWSTKKWSSFTKDSEVKHILWQSWLESLVLFQLSERHSMISFQSKIDKKSR